MDDILRAITYLRDENTQEMGKVCLQDMRDSREGLIEAALLVGKFCVFENILQVFETFLGHEGTYDEKIKAYIVALEANMQDKVEEGFSKFAPERGV